jgi:hypothetical protein
VIAGKLEAYARWDLAEGRLGDAFDGFIRAVATSESVALSGLWTAGYTALWMADAERARAVLREMAARPGRIVATHRRIIESGLAALEGRTADALAGFREARQVLREVGLRFPLALSAIAMTRVLGIGMPDVAEAVDEARAIIRDELRAPPLLQRLDEAAAAVGAAAGTGRLARTADSASVAAVRGDG